MKKQRILSVLLALCLVFSLVPTALAAGAEAFTDVKQGDWCYEYVDYVASKGYFRGTSETAFSPNRNMTRAMFVVVLSRYDGAEVDNSQSAFTDVEPGSWCAGAINWAAANKIVEGKGNGKFAPNDPITRAQMCAIIQRYLDYYTAKHKVEVAEKGTASVMTDKAQIPAYAVNAVKQCQIWGLINGYSDGTFRPQALSTRAHVAAVIYRLAYLVDAAKPAKKPGSGGSGGGGGTGGGGWTPSYTYTLTYDANNGTGAPARQTYTTTASSWTFTVSSTVPTREGYTFQGWEDRDESRVYAPGSTVTLPSTSRSKTLYAVWAPYVMNSATDSQGNRYTSSLDVLPNETITLPAPAARPGYTFLYWQDAQGNIYYAGDSFTAPAAGAHLTAVWASTEQTVYTYTLTYDANGGTGAPAAQTVESTDASWIFTVSNAEPSRSGYVFRGWADTSTATSAQYTGGNSVTLTSATPSKTLYAVWTYPDDLLGNAVIDSVDQVNEKYETLKKAVVEAIEDVNNANGYLTAAQLQKVKDIVNDVVSVEPVTVNFTSGDTTTDRMVSLTVSGSVREGQVVSAVEKAAQVATDLVNGTVSQPSAADVKGFLVNVKNAVEEKSGIVLTNQTLEQIKTQVLNKLTAQGKELWSNFHDGQGTYVCGDMDVVVNGTTYATVVIGPSGPSLSGDKVQIAKTLGSAMSKVMYQDVKGQSAGAYISDPTLTAEMRLNFGTPADADVDAKTESFPRSYRMVLNVELDSDGLVEYKYDAGNYVRLNITSAIQDAYNNAVNEAAATITWNDNTKEQVVGKVEEVMEAQMATLVTEIGNQLSSYGITLTHTTADALKDAVLPKVEGWVETNWTAIVASLGGTGLNGLNNSALINAVWPLIEQDIEDVDMDAVLQAQITEQLTANNINEAWIVDKANNSSALQNARDQLAMFDEVTFDPAAFSLTVTSVDDINALMSYGSIDFTGTKYVTVGGNIMPITMTGTISGPEGSTFGESIRNYIVETAEAQLSTAMESSATLSAMLEENPELADYLLYSALVQIGLEFADEKAEAAGENNSTLTALKATVKTVAKEKMEEKLDQKLAAIDVTDYLEEGAQGAADYQAKIDLLNSLKFPNIQTKTAAGLATALKSAAMADIVGTTGDAYVAQYLTKAVTKAMSLLPAGASVTIAGVTLDKNTLAGLSGADTTVEAIHALADILAQFGDLSINSFAPEAGQMMTVAYNGRTASVYLVIGT